MTRGNDLNEGFKQSPKRRSFLDRSPSFRRKRAKKAREHAEKLVDSLGKGLDKEISEPVAALYFLGIKTTSSCQGHKKRGHSYPWIDLEIDKEKRNEIQKELHLFHFVKKGTYNYPDSYRLLPKEVKDITYPDPKKDWKNHCLEINLFAQKVLGAKKEEN